MKLNSMTPMLETEDLKRTIEFYRDVLGFECRATFPEDAEPVWASLNKDGVTVMFSIRNAHSTIERPTLTGSLYFRPDDVDEAWALLKDRAAVEYPIENFDYGMREFAVRDCNGYLLQFGQEIAEE